MGLAMGVPGITELPRPEVQLSQDGIICTHLCGNGLSKTLRA
jgi:hypothetical protein